MVARRPSHHTQRAYRRDVLSFVDFLGLIWPRDAFRLLLASVADVQRWRDAMMTATKAPKTLNRASPRSPASTSTWPAPPPNSGCPSTSLIPPTPSSSPASRPIRWRARGR